MWLTALRSLLHDRSKFVIALVGVAFAATLSFVQAGIQAGFLESSSAVITHVGGDLWVMAQGTDVLENGDPLAAGTRSIAASDPCVRRVRGVILTFAQTRNPRGGLLAVQVVGFEPSEHHVPWNLSAGLPSDLHGPLRVAVDEYDLEKLHVAGDPLGASLEIGGHIVEIAAVTFGIRSFILAPNVFAEIDTARRLTGVPTDRAHYWVLDLLDPTCAPSVASRIGRHPDLEARTTAEFREMTERYWVTGSGAGAALTFTSMLGLLVGIVIVGQTLFSVAKDHERELATLKAIGASSLELSAFVAWQAAFLCALGSAAGIATAFGIRHFIADLGLRVLLTPDVLAGGVVAMILLCALASVATIRRVVRLEAVEVFR
jgi:putative ABC transport system permease protein